MPFKVSAGCWILDVFPERYVPAGYWDSIELDKQLKILSEIEGLDGLGIIYPTHPLPNDPDKLQKKLADFGLKLADISVDNYSHRKWKHGAFVTNEERIRKESVNLCKECIDFAAEIPDTAVTLWPAHDGFDYPFQAGYRREWEHFIHTCREICEHNLKVKIAIEYKQKDPRQRQYLSNVGKTMMLINDVGMRNFTAVFDTGHALMSNENLAESVIILDMHNKLGTVHLNDNYRDADPDLVFGALAFWDNLEMFYHLIKIGYKDWLEIDITSGRDDRIKSANLVVKLTRKYEELANRLISHESQIDENLKEYRFADNMDLISDVLFP